MQSSFSAIGSTPSSPSLAVIGGGLAGIAAAEAAERQGFDVELFEWARCLGGRATSMFEPEARQWIDNGQHVALGCCTELLALHRRLGLERFFERQGDITFVSTEGKRWTIAASPFLPLRWQLVPAFLKMPFLSFKDRLATGLLLRKLPKIREKGTEPDVSFGDWLASERASDASVEKFWAPLVFSALSETVDNVSFAAVRKVVRDAFLSGREAMSMYVPTQPLRAIYHQAVSEHLTRSGVRLHFLSRVRQLQWTAEEDETPRIVSLTLADGTVRSFDRYVLAIPSFHAWKLLEESGLDGFAEQLDLGRFEPGAITTAHCWFNRRLLPPTQRQAALIGGPAQFLFCPSTESDEYGVYHTAVISASHRLLSDVELTSQGTAALLERIVEQLRKTFPEAFQEPTELLHGRTTTVFNAVFSPNPNVYGSRPDSATPFENLALAGDWTHTDWPATLEGAVRSGIAAVDMLCR